MSKDNLKNYLLDKAKELKPDIFADGDCIRYAEDVNPDAINGDDWLKNRTPYIWKIGVLITNDSNKCDWVDVFIAHEREPNNIDFIGHLNWPDGENDDIGRSVQRYVKLLQNNHYIFEVEND